MFTTESKPLEVEIVVAEVGRAAAGDQIYRLAYDGSVDRRARLRRHGRPGRAARRGCWPSEWRAGLTLPEVLALAVRTLGAPAEDGGEPRAIPAAQLEVAVLDRTRPRRTFRRLAGALLEDLLGAD